AEERVIWRESASITRILLEEALENLGVLNMISSYLEINSIQSIINSVEEGLGVSILPMAAVKKEIESGRLTAVRVSELNLTRSLFIVQNNLRFKKRVMHDFLELIKSIN